MASTPAWIQGVTTHFIPPRIIFVHAKAEAFWKNEKIKQLILIAQNNSEILNKLDLEGRKVILNIYYQKVGFRTELFKMT